MSTTILDTPSLAISRCASMCDRCVNRRGECVQFVAGREHHVYTLCLQCWAELCRAISQRQEFQP